MLVPIEHRQDGVTPEAEQVTVLEENDLDQFAEGAIHDPSHDFGAAFAHLLHQPLGEGGEPRDVGEQDRPVDVTRPQIRSFGHPLDSRPGDVEGVLGGRHARKLLEESLARLPLPG